MNTVYCYDRHAQVKRAALGSFVAAAATSAVFLLMSLPGSAIAQDAQRVEHLPRVVITGKAVRAPADVVAQVTQLPRVVVIGHATHSVA